MKSLSPLQKISTPLFNAAEIDVWVKRDDLINSPFAGNKHRKLLPHLEQAIQGGATSIISCGGAFSNHLHALSYIPERYRLKVVAFVRGEASDKDNPNLALLKYKGVQIKPISRADFAEVHNLMKQFAEKLGTAYIVPEGGTDHIGSKGMQPCMEEIINDLGCEPDYIICPVGSGGTMAGLINASKDTHILGVPAVKGEKAMVEVSKKVQKWADPNKKTWSLIQNDLFGRFGFLNAHLFDTSIKIFNDWGIAVDPIYTVRCFGMTNQLVKEGFFKKGAKIVCLHSGGLQGWDGMKYRYAEKYNFDLLRFYKN